MQHKCFFVTGQKRKRGYDSSAAEDEDFVCLAEDSEEDLVRPSSKRSSRGFTAKRMSVSLTLPSLCLRVRQSVLRPLAALQYTGPYLKVSNGLQYGVMKPVWESADVNKTL